MRTTSDSIGNRIKLAINRALVHLINDGGKRQLLQVEPSQGEIKDNVERIGNYGFTSHPLPGAQAVMLCVGGNRDHPMVVAVDDPRHRLHNLQAGEVALYTDEGDTIVMRRGGIIEITTKQLVVKAQEKARFETPVLQVTGQVHDMCDVQPHTMSGMRDIYNGHTHPENNTNGGNTNDPNQKMDI